jgi:hypothetical protein
MQRSRYKYVSNLDHAKWFQQGKMFCRTAAYYRDYEDSKAMEVIGDQYEGTRLYRPLNGLEFNNLTQGTRRDEPGKFIYQELQFFSAGSRIDNRNDTIEVSGPAKRNDVVVVSVRRGDLGRNVFVGQAPNTSNGSLLWRLYIQNLFSVRT